MKSVFGQKNKDNRLVIKQTQHTHKHFIMNDEENQLGPIASVEIYLCQVT